MRTSPSRSDANRAKLFKLMRIVRALKLQIAEPNKVQELMQLNPKYRHRHQAENCDND